MSINQLHTFESQSDVDESPLLINDKIRIKGQSSEITHKAGLLIDTREGVDIKIEDLEISNVFRPLFKKGNGKVHIKNLHLHHFGGDGIRLWGSNLTIDNLLIEQNEKVMPYSSMTIPMTPDQVTAYKTNPYDPNHRRPTKQQFDEVFRTLKFGNQPELPVKDFSLISWMIGEGSNKYFQIGGEHIDVALQAWIPPEQPDRLIMNSVVIERIIEEILKERPSLSEDDVWFALAAGFSHLKTESVFDENGQLIGYEVLEPIEKFKIESLQRKIESTALTDIVSVEKIYKIVNDVVKPTTLRFQKDYKHKTIENIKIHNIEIRDLHPESQVFTLSEYDFYRGFIIGDEKLLVDTEFPFWFNAISLSNSTIGTDDELKCIVKNSKVRIGEAYWWQNLTDQECFEEKNCIKLSAHDNKVEDVILKNVGNNAVQVNGVVSS